MATLNKEIFAERIKFPVMARALANAQDVIDERRLISDP